MIAGHDHLYERFTPGGPVTAPRRREGHPAVHGRHRRRAALQPRAQRANSELLISNFGMLRLKLDPALYEWTFMDMNGAVLDRGLNVCH